MVARLGREDILPGELLEVIPEGENVVRVLTVNLGLLPCPSVDLDEVVGLHPSVLALPGLVGSRTFTPAKARQA